MVNTRRSLIAIGTQFGDEGKGKIISFLAHHLKPDRVVRKNGGSNAGHTIWISETEKYVTHLIPSGFLSGVKGVIGPIVAIIPENFVEEIDALKARGYNITPSNLSISGRNLVTTLYHRIEDGWGRKDENSIGTTKQGIGPTHEDYVARRGIFLEELIDNPNLVREKVKERLSSPRYRHLKNDGLTEEQVIEDLLKYRDKIAPFVTDTVEEVVQLLENGKRIIFEGAQGHHISRTTGVHPFVSSSNATVTGVYEAFGDISEFIEEKIGVVKGYLSRVGKGYHPTLAISPSDVIQRVGEELGATTKRKRDCGWLDLPMIQKAVRHNRLTSLALTRLDTLEDIGKEVGYVAIQSNYGLMQFEPFNNVRDARTFEELDPEAQRFIHVIEKTLQVPIKYIGNGKVRDQMIVRN